MGHLTTPGERVQKAARSGVRKGLIGLVLGTALMLIINSQGSTLMFVATGVFVVSALVYTAASIMAVRARR